MILSLKRVDVCDTLRSTLRRVPGNREQQGLIDTKILGGTTHWPSQPLTLVRWFSSFCAKDAYARAHSSITMSVPASMRSLHHSLPHERVLALSHFLRFTCVLPRFSARTKEVISGLLMVTH